MKPIEITIHHEDEKIRDKFAGMLDQLMADIGLLVVNEIETSKNYRPKSENLDVYGYPNVSGSSQRVIIKRRTV